MNDHINEIADFVAWKQKRHLENQKQSRWFNVLQATLLGSVLMAGCWLFFAVIWL